MLNDITKVFLFRNDKLASSVARWISASVYIVYWLRLEIWWQSLAGSNPATGGLFIINKWSSLPWLYVVVSFGGDFKMAVSCRVQTLAIGDLKLTST